MWVYLSPHFDDTVYSCGGLIALQAQSGQAVQVWTACGGEIPLGPLTPFAEELHARWGTGLASVEARRQEDQAACRRLGAGWRHYSLPDCIYRRLPSGEPLVNQNDDLWQTVPPGEAAQVAGLAEWLRQGLAKLDGKARLVSPLGVGGHIDHRLARAAAESLGLPLWYYADYPYAVKNGFDPAPWLGRGRRAYARRLSAGAVQAWQAAAETYATQLSSFWSGPEDMRQAIAAYALSLPGHCLWRPARQIC